MKVQEKFSFYLQIDLHLSTCNFVIETNMQYNTMHGQQNWVAAPDFCDREQELNILVVEIKRSKY